MEQVPRLSPLFTWRSAVSSQHGPASATCRHVLLCLSLHMNERGGSCFPTVALLAKETNLSTRIIEEHLRSAAEEGWIVRKEMHATGRGWRRITYTARVPHSARAGIQREWEEEASEGADEVRNLDDRGAERGSAARDEVRNLDARRAERGSGKVVNRSTKGGGTAGKKKLKGKPVTTWTGPTKKHEALAAELGLDVGDQAERFRDHALDKGRRSSRWAAAFTNWLKKEADYRDERGVGVPRHEAVVGESGMRLI